MEAIPETGKDESGDGGIMIRTLLPALFLVLVSSAAMGDEVAALKRLMNMVESFHEMGDELVGEPITGTLGLGDTAELELTLDSSFMYHVHVWSDSYFNIMDIWLNDPRGEQWDVAAGDNASLAVYPDTSGSWTLNLLLVEGAYSDSASYAAVLFRGRRYTE